MWLVMPIFSGRQSIRRKRKRTRFGLMQLYKLLFPSIPFRNPRVTIQFPDLSHLPANQANYSLHFLQQTRTGRRGEKGEFRQEESGERGEGGRVGKGARQKRADPCVPGALGYLPVDVGCAWMRPADPLVSARVGKGMGEEREKRRKGRGGKKCQGTTAIRHYLAKCR